jgi:hypothetical protein
MPIRNGSDFIARSPQAVVAQDCPQDGLEGIAAAGLRSDRVSVYLFRSRRAGRLRQTFVRSASR